jgi:hypothetical protein
LSKIFFRDNAIGKKQVFRSGAPELVVADSASNADPPVQFKLEGIAGAKNVIAAIADGLLKVICAI